MSDNATAHWAGDYDGKIEQTIPCYRIFHEQVLNLVRAYCYNPKTWLDTGCGTGIMAAKVRSLFPDTSLMLADPSGAMLDIARQKLVTYPPKMFIEAATQELAETENSYEVITAILSHHYLDASTRLIATQNCYRMLEKEGIYITVETIRPSTELGIKMGLQRWKSYQMEMGKSADEAEAHIARFGQEYYPITIEEHLALLRKAGFTSCEILWASYMQAVFFAIK